LLIREVNQVLQILVKKSLGENVTLYEVSHSYPPTHFEQTDAASLLGGALGPDQSIEISIVSGSAIIYGATADNTTNDSSIQFARQSD
jgi:hypothetical protein